MPLDFVCSEFGLTWVLAQGTPATLQGDAGSFDWLEGAAQPPLATVSPKSLEQFA